MPLGERSGEEFEGHGFVDPLLVSPVFPFVATRLF